MTLKININALMQYFLIYIMLLVPGSNLYAKFLGDYKYYLVIIPCFAFILLFRKYRDFHTIWFLIFLLLTTIFVRITAGGVGIAAWLQFAACILITLIAISYNPQRFLQRWVKCVVFFAITSLIYFTILTLFPVLIDKLLPSEYLTQILGSTGYERFWYGRGLLLYSFLEMHPTRNCGIYTEPGVYQVVLNSALFILLFLDDKLEFKKKRNKTFALFIILITLIVCQSTTGYFGLLINIFFFYLTKRDSYYVRLKRQVSIILSLVIIGLIANYVIAGENSILTNVVYNKLFSSTSNRFDISSNTGVYRWGTILISFSSVLNHPFGVGYDELNLLLSQEGGLVAAIIMKFAAVYGVIPWIVMLYWIFKPIFKYGKSTLIGLCFVLLFINTTLAQTDLFYPALIMFPLYFQICSVKSKHRLPPKWPNQGKKI